MFLLNATDFRLFLWAEVGPSYDVYNERMMSDFRVLQLPFFVLKPSYY